MRFDDFCKRFGGDLKTRDLVPEISRTQIEVLLARRFRGETLGDRIGRWNYTTNNYVTPNIVDVIPFNIYTENIVKPKIRANASVMASSKIAIVANPKRENSRAKKNAMIAQKICDDTDATKWDDHLQFQLSEQKQLSHGVFLESFFNPEKQGCVVETDEWDEEDFELPSVMVCATCGRAEFTQSAPESENAVASQLESALDENSPRLAVLLSANAQVPDELQSLFLPVQTNEGILLVNQEKANKVGLTDVQSYVTRNGYANLLGKVEDHTGATEDGLTVRTEDPEGNELVSSVVKDPHNVESQKQLDSAQFPNGLQKVLPTEHAVQARHAENPANPLCPDCQTEMEVIEPPENVKMDVLKGKREVPLGDNDLRIRHALEFRVDERYSQGGRIDKMRWLEDRELKSRFEVELAYGRDDLGTPSEWCYALKWLYTLQTGVEYPFRSFTQTTNTIQSLDIFEVRKFYFTPEFLGSYTADEDYDFTNKKTKHKFKIKKNQNAGEVVRKMAHEHYERTGAKEEGLCVAVTGDEILDIYLWDFRQHLAYTYFLADPFSFWGMCCSELETHQHLVNQMLTAIGNQVQSNKNTIAADGFVWDEEDFDGSRDINLTNEMLNQPIGNTFEIIPGVAVTADTWNLYSQMKQAAMEVSLVSPSMQGQPTGDKTYAAQKLQRDMSLGLLSPAQNSTAAAKTEVFRQQVQIAKANWSAERLATLCVSGDGIITEDDVEKFFECDLATDVVFDYLSGSEMPKTQVEKQADIYEYVQFLAETVNLSAQPLSASVINDLRSKMAEYKNIEGLDIENAEIDKEVAENRYEFIDKNVKKITESQVMFGQNGESLLAQKVGEMMNNPLLSPLPTENHLVAQEFYADKMRLEYKKEVPDIMMVTALMTMYQRHREALIVFGQQEIQTQMAIQQPAIQQQQAMEAETAQQQMQGQEQQLALQSAEKDKELSNQAEQRNFEMQKTGLEMMNSQADREHQKEIKEMELKASAKR